MPLVLHTLIEGALTVFSAMHRCCDSAKELKTTWPTSQSGSDQGLGCNTKGTRESSDQEVSVPSRDASFCTLQRTSQGEKRGLHTGAATPSETRLLVSLLIKTTVHHPTSLPPSAWARLKWTHSIRIFF